ncbi:replication initiation and membrane attachment family protein [Ammoniphilus sp. CFH 90114]|uniref:replication initiation and membrane attachment family protein n=1 Tax=Ammoniphilus sp. CFH 90114 TaxID=2493665 RepID=UPI00100F4A5A|nr:DnaD domain protein [Ammoniphilus sp. CFH 90114]RXT04764.1 hypothetical protein EIZ39_18705 [Ammoniphilus sp. CFH 90114]
MGFAWKEIVPGDNYTLGMTGEMSFIEFTAITHLYQPLIGPHSVSLYMTLYHEWLLHAKESSWSSHRGLMSVMGLSLKEIVQAREGLEAIGLLRTLKVEDEQGNRHYEYILQPPISASSFFGDDMLSIILLNRIGKVKYEHLRRSMVGPSLEGIVYGERNEITKSFDEVFRHISSSEIMVTPGSETEQFLHQMDSLYPVSKGDSTEPRQQLSFSHIEPDFAFLEASLPKSVQRRRLSKDQRDAIKELVFYYQLQDMQLSYFLQDPFVYSDDNELDLDRLRKLAKDWYTAQHNGQMPEVIRPTPTNQAAGVSPAPSAKPSIEDEHREALVRLSPLALLEQYQGGSKVSPADMKIVEELSRNYSLSPGVINVLLEYVMLTNNKQLPPALIYKIATHWKRLAIGSVDQALEQAKKLYQDSKTRSSSPKQDGSAKSNSNTKRNAWNNKKDELPEWVVKQMNETPKPAGELDEKQKKQALELLKALGEIE